MKQTIVVLTVLASFFAISCTSAPKSDEAEVKDAQKVSDTAGTAYSVDTDRSKVEWVGTKITGRHNGEINISGGTLSVAAGKVVGGDFTIDMTTLKGTDTKMDAEGNGKLGGHLMSPDFFDVENHPTATFKITDVKALEGTANTGDEMEELTAYKLANPTHKIAGNLMMKGVTKNITFPAEIVVSPNGVKAKAKFNIDRTDWGVTYSGKADDVISNTVNLGIQLTSAN